MSKIVSILDKCVVLTILAVCFLIPLFFLPFTQDYLYINKLILLSGLILISSICWVSRQINERRFKVIRTPLDIFLLGFLAIYLASSIFSVNKFNSFIKVRDFGLPSFLGIFFLVALYFLIVNNFNTLRKLKILFYSMFFSAFLLLIIVFTNFIGKSIFSLFNLPNIIPIGTISSFLIFTISLLPLPISIILNKNSKKFLLILSLIYCLLCIIVLNIINYRIGFYAGIIVSFILLVIYISKIEEFPLRINYFFLLGFLLTFSIVSLLIRMPRVISFGLPTEVNLTHKLAFKMAIKTALEDPLKILVGTGPGNFSYTFSKYKPDTINNTIFWNTRFNSSSDIISEMIATLGWIGIISFIMLILVILGVGLYFLIKSSSKSNIKEVNFKDRTSVSKFKSVFTEKFYIDPEKQSLMIASFASLLSIIILGLFVQFNLTLFSYFFILTASFISSTIIAYPKEYKIKEVILKTSPKYALLTSFSFVLVFVILIVLGVYLGRIYAGEYYYNLALKSIQKNELNKAQVYIQKAIYNNRNLSTYYLTYSQVSLTRARREVEKAQEEKRKVDENVLSLYLSNAINSSAKAVDLAPKDAWVWQTRGSIFENVVAFVNGAGEWAKKSYLKVTELEPTNPVAWFNLGRIEFNLSLDKDGKIKDSKLASDAIKHLEKAIELKPDFWNARITLARVKEVKGEIDEAIGSIRAAFQFFGSRNNANLYYELGRLLYNKYTKTKDDDILKQAQLNLEQAVDISPVFANALYSLAIVYEAQGEISKAIEKLEKVKQYNPDNQVVSQKLKELKSKLSPPKTSESEEKIETESIKTEEKSE